MSVMVLLHIPWASRVWDLPFLTALTSLEGFYKDKNAPINYPEPLSVSLRSPVELICKGPCAPLLSGI
ncbi:hypothetical protein CLV58_13513 [Spirosoma oryzae]|uniref:Uncharacterized protein n=1 Tax=Spirosoma oryzae TaxID=1469603 RepID=A0A2T0S0Q1_9BACT|nr:hypothetical protein CLV58_13513 [Spirosoma oryzae]